MSAAGELPPDKPADDVLPVDDRPPSWQRRSYRFRYSLIGALLATGAPIGALALRLLFGEHHLRGELAGHGFFYAYQLVGTLLVFVGGGWFAGRRADRLRRGRDRFRELAGRDLLTGLPNDRAFRQHFRRVADRAARGGEALSLLLVDLDKLKSINDRWGHAAGSEALARLADALEAAKRTEDMAARWGGDEFTILMPGAGGDAAERVAQRILEQLDRQPISGDGVRVTATIGVATAVGSVKLDDLFARADRALYLGKSEGRNCYRVATKSG